MAKEKPVKKSSYVASKFFNLDDHLVMIDRDLKTIFPYTAKLPQNANVTSQGVAGVGTATILSLSANPCKSAGFIRFVFNSGTTAFVPFFVSSST